LFGQTKPLFGSSTTNPAQPNAFGGGTTSIFGSTQPTTQSGSLFSTGFGDYIANRRGATTGGGLTFGQTQPTTSTSLFGGNTATTQSSLFGAQNKSLFGVICLLRSFDIRKTN
uniref:Nucleoporin Nup98 n=1 Tax=Anisakis simplex TaxID=6269 RepID=A0A0M3KK98_ANISI